MLEYDTNDLEGAKLRQQQGHGVFLYRHRLPVSLKKLSIKQISLALLVLQNSILVVLMHYSRVAPVIGTRRYFPSTAIVLVEIVKLVISITVVFRDISIDFPSRSTYQLFQKLCSALLTSDSWKLAIPALLWTLQNSIIYVAVSNLDPATFQVTYQLKILTTVLFSIVLLGRKISAKQWLSLLLLTVGVAIVQTSGRPISISTILTDFQSTLTTILKPRAKATSHEMESISGTLGAAAPPATPLMDPSRGILAVVVAALISGITGVYFEKVLKDSSSSATMWTRNAQLAFFSLFPALFIGVLWQDGHDISRDGFFVGYNSVVLAIIALQAVGGIIVAICIAHTDNIVKNFAASVSIAFSCVANAVIFDIPLTLNFTFGTAVVLLAAYLYHGFTAHQKPTNS